MTNRFKFPSAHADQVDFLPHINYSSARRINSHLMKLHSHGSLSYKKTSPDTSTTAKQPLINNTQESTTLATQDSVLTTHLRKLHKSQLTSRTAQQLITNTKPL